MDARTLTLIADAEMGSDGFTMIRPHDGLNKREIDHIIYEQPIHRTPKRIQENKERVRKYMREWAQEHRRTLSPEQRSALNKQQRARYAAQTEEQRIKTNKRNRKYQMHPEINARRNKAARERYAKKRAQAIASKAI